MNAVKLDNWAVTVFLPDGTVETASLLALPEWRDRAELEWSDGLVAALDGEATVLLPADHAVAAALWEAWASGAAAPGVRITRRDATTFLPVSVPVWAGYLKGMEEEDGAVRLRMSRAMPGGDVAMCRDAAALAGFAGIPKGSYLPQVFGDVAGVRAVRLRGGARRARLRFALGDDATIFVLAGDVEDWPAEGTIQVADELIAYTAIAPDGTVGSLESPCVRTSPRSHPAGTDAWLAPEEGYLWAACDHPATIVETYADTGDQEVAFPAETVVAEADLAGRAAMLVSSGQAPVRVRESLNAALRVSEGKYAGQWQLETPTSADFPTNAFEASEGAAGAVLSWLRPLLSASYLPALARSPWRFDRIRRAALLLDLYAAEGWDAATRLRVEITRGSVVREWFVSFEGYISLLSAPIEEDGLERESAAPIPYLTVQLDFTSEIAEPYGWDWWGGEEGTAPLVRMELVDAPEGGIAVVRGVQWLIEVQPAASIRITDDLRCDIQGRHRELDGFCHPADAIRTLLEDTDFAGVPVAPADEAAWDDARDAIGARGVRYAAAIADARKVRQALARALGETGAILSPEGYRLLPRVLPVWPVIGDPTDIAPADELPRLVRRTTAAPPGEAAPTVLLANPPSTALWTRDGQGPAWQADWIAAGADAMPELAAAWCAGNRIEAEIRIPARASSDPAPFGAPYLHIDTGLRGTLRQRTHRATAAGTLRIAGNGAILLAAPGEWHIWQMPALEAIAFVRGTVRVALLEASGTFSIRGAAEEDTADTHGTGPIAGRPDGSLALLAQAGEDKATLILTPEGNLRCTGPIQSGLGPLGLPAVDGLNTGSGFLRLAPGAQTVAELSPSNGFRLSGALREGWAGE